MLNRYKIKENDKLNNTDLLILIKNKLKQKLISNK